MKIVIALDSFKGSLSAYEACCAVEKGLKDCDPLIETVKLPISDGGDGLIEAVEIALVQSGFVCCEKIARGPYGQQASAKYLIKGEECVLEMAQSCGINLQPASLLHAVKASTYGLGEVMREALDQGCRRFRIGLGGSATNDGGAGFMQALGVKFYDDEGRLMESPIAGGKLKALRELDVSGLDPRIKDCTVQIISDVSNPLLGPSGATAVFGPQKGVREGELDLLEEGMRNYADLLTKTLGRDCRDIPGAGAAGGLGACLLWFFNSHISSGIDAVLDLIGFEGKLAGADLVITGEGRMDAQSAFGKAPSGVAKRAKKHSLPVAAICGSLEEDAEILYREGIDAMFSICTGPMRLEEAMADAGKLLLHTSCNVVRLFKAAEKAQVKKLS